MFRELFQKLFGRQFADPLESILKSAPAVFQSPLQALQDRIAPRDLGLEIVTTGDPTHGHSFVPVPWDRERFGSYFCDPDPDPGTPIAFPMATYKDLLRCQCGAEGVKSTRALI